MQVSINQLQEMTSKSYRTVKRKIDGLIPVGKKGRANLYNCTDALEAIYSTQIASDLGPGEKIDLSTERALLARSQRLKYDLENAKAQGELIPAAAVKETWSRIVISAKTQFLALPDRLAQMLETCESIEDRRALIDAEVKTILIALSEDKEPEPIKPKAVKRKVKKKSKPKKKPAAKKKKAVKKKSKGKK